MPRNGGGRVAPRSGIRRALEELQRSLGNPEAMVHAYGKAKRDTFALRLMLGLLDRIYPVHAFLILANEFNREIEKTGYASACQSAIPQLVGEWRSTVPLDVEPLLHTGATVFYGNHPSLATPFLLGAAVPRADLRFVSTSYVCKLIPAFGARSYPVEMPLRRMSTELRRGGAKRVMAHGLMSLLHAVPDREALKVHNRRSLNQAAEHVRQGGSLVICPDGGGTKSRHWYSGIAHIARASAESGADVRFVPFHEVNCTNRRIYPRLMRGPVASLRARRHNRHPVRLDFGHPIAASALEPEKRSVEEILGALRRHYESIRL